MKLDKSLMLNIIILNIYMITAFFLMDHDIGYSSKFGSDGSLEASTLLFPTLVGSFFTSLSVYYKGTIPLIILSALAVLCFFIGPWCMFGIFQISNDIMYYNYLYHAQAAQCQLFIIFIVTIVLCFLVTPKKHISYFVLGSWYLLAATVAIISRFYYPVHDSHSFYAGFSNSWWYLINPLVSKAGFLAAVVSLVILNVLQLALSTYSLIAKNADE